MPRERRESEGSFDMLPRGARFECGVEARARNGRTSGCCFARVDVETAATGERAAGKIHQAGYGRGEEAIRRRARRSARGNTAEAGSAQNGGEKNRRAPETGR